MTRRGISDMTRFTPDAVQEKYGLTPAQYPDYAALRGDPSDNLPGIPGVGEKTAAKWVAEYGSLAALVDKVDQVKGRAGDNLRENLGNVLRNRQLTELTRNVPLDVGPADLVPVPWDRDQIHQLFDTLQFRVLRDRLYATLPNGIIAQLSAAAAGQPQRPASTSRSPGSARASWPAGWPLTPGAAGSGWRSTAPGAGAPATSTGSRSPRRQRARATTARRGRL